MNNTKSATGLRFAVRLILDKVYLWSGYLAAACLVAIAVSIALQVLGRIIGLGIDSTRVAGFWLAASSFFALAHTFKRGAHVRVTIVIHQFSGISRQLIEIVCCSAAAIAVGYLAYYSILMVVQSYNFHNFTPGLLAIPLWIPQLAMAIGVTLLDVALIDEAVSIAKGSEPSYQSNKDNALD